ncbi:MAG: EAL domain-containing protein [Sphingobium sp.]
MLDLKASAITAHDGRYLGPMLTWAIVTKEVEAERRIRQLAHFDTLTGLANRITFNEQMDASLAAPGEGPGLLFIDLDGFKLVNDTRGHRTGDELLRQVAIRLRDTCDDADMTIGRLGRDEFAVLVPHDAPDNLERLATNIIDSLSRPYELEDNRQAQLGASIGIALAPVHGNTGEALLARADMALYAAKAAGKGTCRMFSEEMESSIQDRLRLQARLRAALHTYEGLFVFYQPIIDARSNRVTAREALIRWYNPERGWTSPAEFVPIAEQCGLIDQLGEFVLNTACRDAATWEDGARVAVNVSAAQLGKGTIAPVILSALTRSGLSPDRLEIEVTETAMLDDEHGGIGDLRRIRDMGVRVALDDFGTGYSSLTHLRAFPFDKIKIDGSFVKDALTRPESAAIVRAIVDLGNRLGVTTVAEGVETESHLARVLEEGCTEIQGYVYGRPEPAERDRSKVAAISEQLTAIAHFPAAIDETR